MCLLEWFVFYWLRKATNLYMLYTEKNLELIASVFSFNASACYFDAAAGKTQLMDEQLLVVFSDTKWFDFGVSFS